MKLSPGLFLIGIGSVLFTSYSLALEVGVFNITGIDVTLTVNGSVSLDTGIFFIDSGNVGIYGACQPGNIIDRLAIDAPYPPADFFVPEIDAQPTLVLSPDQAFGAGSTDPGSAIYITYYNSTTQLWNDTGYQSQYPGTLIPADLKERVSDQTYLYGEYLIGIAAWQSEYDQERLFQWPYYWAQNVARAPGAMPGGADDCGCQCHIPLLDNTIVAAEQTVLGGTGVSVNDTFDIGGTHYTVGQLFAMVLKDLAKP